MKTVLFIVHDYPPIHTAGTERVLKFAHHLPDFGYRPLILTTARYGGLPDDPLHGVYRAGDLIHTLFSPWRRRSRDLPAETQVQIATLSGHSRLGRLRDQLLTPDTKLGWLRPAVRLGRQLIARHRPALLFSSSPPETAHLIARRLQQSSGLPWVADLRDGWLFEPPNPSLRQPAWRQGWEARMERDVVGQASAIVAATDPIGDDLRQRHPQAAAKITTLSNGYDEAEFAGLERHPRPDDRFLLTYTGSLAASRAGTSAEAFFQALALHRQQHPATKLRVRMVGNISAAEQAAAPALGDLVEFVPAVSRRQAHQHQLDADALLLITAPGQRSVATLKLFEYIRAGAPILALAADNAAAAIVQADDLGITVPPNDPAAIAAALPALMQRPRNDAAGPDFERLRSRYERRQLTAQLAQIFDSHGTRNPEA
jgi:glycosyltransferase involved in cell wall biosynthesis